MQSPARLPLTIAVATTLLVVGCGKREVEPDARNKVEAGKQESSGLSAARLKYKSEVQSKPKSAEARYQLGNQLLIEGDAQDAVSELQRARELKHPEAIVVPRLAEAMMQAGQFKELSLAFGDTQLADAAGQARLLSARAYAMASLDDSAGAQKLVDQALASQPQSAEALLMKARLAGVRDDLPAGLATLDTLLAAHPLDDAAWALKGDLLLRKPDGRQAAMAAYEQALKARPDQVYSLSALIALYLAQDDLDAAKARFAILSKVAPKHLTTANVEAHLAYAKGDHLRAREIFQSLLRVMPDNVNLLVASGDNEMRLQSYIQAESQFAKAVTLDPQHFQARRLLGKTQLLLGQAAKAKNTLLPLLDRPDVNADAMAMAAEAYLLNGEPKQANALYTRIAKLKPTDPRMRTLLASAALSQRDDASLFTELRSIASSDSGTSADLAIISAHLRREQLDAALEALAGLEKKQPKDPMVHNLRGQVLVKKKDFAGARQSFEQALKLNPLYFPAVAALSALDMQDNKPDDARKRLDSLLKEQPKNPQAILSIADLQKRQRAPRADVLKTIESAVKVAPSDVDARTALISHHFDGNDFQAALNAAQAATSALPESVELNELLARCQMRVKQYSQAIASYGKVVTLLPKSARGHVGLADVYLANNQLDQAQRSIDRALELSPGLPEAQAQSAVVALRRNRPDAAIAIAREMQKARPTEAVGFLLEGDIEMRLTRWDTAIAALKQSLDKASPGAAPVKLYQAYLGANKPADAQAFANQWLKGHPRDVGLLFLMGNVAQEKGDLATADRHYSSVLTIDPGHIASLNNLAMVKLELKQPGATALAEKAVAGAPDEPAMLDTLAQALAAENNISRAIEVQKRAVAIAPEVPDLRLNLARWQLQAGDKAQAKGELDRLAKLGKQFKQHEEVARLKQSLEASMLRR